MNTNVRWTTKLLLLFTVLITLACGAAAQATSEPAVKSAPTQASEPTAVPTEAPTEAPAADLDVSTARIYLTELPAGFEELPGDELNADSAAGEDDFQPAFTFGFANSTDFQMIIGMNFLLDKGLDRLGFGLALNQQEEVLKEFVSAMGTSNTHDEKILEGFEDIGKSQVAMSMIGELEGIPMQVDVLMLQRDEIAGVLISMTLEGTQPKISLHELGVLFDTHIQETLDAAP